MALDGYGDPWGLRSEARKCYRSVSARVARSSSPWWLCFQDEKSTSNHLQSHKTSLCETRSQTGCQLVVAMYNRIKRADQEGGESGLELPCHSLNFVLLQSMSADEPAS